VRYTLTSWADEHVAPSRFGFSFGCFFLLLALALELCLVRFVSCSFASLRFVAVAVLNIILRLNRLAP
jgi:hypothetical protein